MPLILTIENETSMPDGGPLSVTVSNKRGIDIGRDQYLDWVLHDPSRFISGKHCEIRFSDGQYWLRDVSTNGTFINRSEFRPNGPHALQNGDQIEIGRYIISVRVEPDGHEGFADSQAGGMGQAGAIWDTGGDAPPPINPNELRARPAAGNGSDFLDWAADIAPAQPLPPAYAPPPVFSPPPPAPPASGWEMPAPARPAPPPAPVLPAAPAPAAVWTMDDLPAPPPGMAARPVGVAPADTSGNEPPAALRIETPPDSLPDHPAPELPAPAPAPAAPIFDSPVAAPTPPPVQAPAPTPSPAFQPPAAPRPPAYTAGGPEAEFIARFARAAGLTEDVVRSRDAGALAEMLGVFVRVTADNLRQLHAARAQSKGAMRSANVTMIQLTDNNPLRFSPSTEDALRIMFGPPTNSYLDASRTLESSFGDLKRHQMQVFSAMQTALRQLVADLDPKSVESSIPPDKSVGSLLRSREARLWEHYQTVWKARAGTSEHGMLDVFMRLFAEAYDKS